MCKIDCFLIVSIYILKKEFSFNQIDRYCGVLDAERIGLVTSIERIVEFVFMQALAYPNIENDDEEMNCNLIKQQLLPGLRSFCSALRVCEQVCSKNNIFDDGKVIVGKADSLVEVKEMSKEPEVISELEERVTNWIKSISKVLMESEQLRTETDSSGPQDELEYWKRRGAQFSQLLAYLQVCVIQITSLKTYFN